jgi:hypothetical protein
MGLFGFLGKAVTGPFRAVGKLVTGHPLEALGALGDTLKVAAPFIPGVGIPAAIGLSALGGAMQTLDDPNKSAGAFLKNALAGGAVGGLGGIGKLLLTPAPNVGTMTAAAGAPAQTGMAGLGGGVLTGPGVQLPSGLAPAATAAGPGLLQKVGQGIQDIGSWTRGAAGDVLNWAQANPYLALGTMSTGANLLGGMQQAEMYNRELEEQRRQEQLQMLLNIYRSFPTASVGG